MHIEFDEAECNELLQLLDAAVRSAGLQTVAPASVWIGKLKAAREAEAVPDKPNPTRRPKTTKIGEIDGR